MSDALRPDMPGAHTPAPLEPCDVFSEEIHLLADRELGPAESSVVEEHLAECARCQALAVHLERMSSVLKAWDAQANDVEAPAQRLKNAVLARVAEQSLRRRRDDRIVRVIHYATAALVVLGLGLGLFLGLTERRPQVVAPEVTISAAPMPLDVHPEGAIVVRGGSFAEPYTAADISAGIQVPVMAELERFDALGAWDRLLWKRRSDDGLPLLVGRFQRMEEVERRLGARVVFWNGPSADKRDGERHDHPLVTLTALNFLHQKGYLKRWMRNATETSPTVVAKRTPVVTSRSTGVTARSMLQPMPGIDRDLRSLRMRSQMIRVFAPKLMGSAANASKRKAERVHLLDGWALAREKSNGGLKSGPLGSARLDPSRVTFADPVAANANGQLHFAESGQGANTVVVIVKGTRQPIYIPAGQFLTGGIADRVIAHPVWLPATRSKKPFIVHCRVVQNFEHGDASQPLSLQPEIVGPTIRALLAAGASPRKVKRAAGELMTAVYRQKGTLLGDWSLFGLYRGRYAAEGHTLANVRWDGITGFVITDAHGRFVGSEVVRPTGHAATELLRRLWVSYSTEAGQRHFARERAGFAAPSDGLAQVMRRLAAHDGTFHTPQGVEQRRGARVSAMEIVAAGVHMHALEIAESAAIVSTLSSAP